MRTQVQVFISSFSAARPFSRKSAQETKNRQAYIRVLSHSTLAVFKKIMAISVFPYSGGEGAFCSIRSAKCSAVREAVQSAQKTVMVIPFTMPYRTILLGPRACAALIRFGIVEGTIRADSVLLCSLNYPCFACFRLFFQVHSMRGSPAALLLRFARLSPPPRYDTLTFRTPVFLAFSMCWVFWTALPGPLCAGLACRRLRRLCCTSGR